MDGREFSGRRAAVSLTLCSADVVVLIGAKLDSTQQSLPPNVTPKKQKHTHTHMHIQKDRDSLG